MLLSRKNYEKPANSLFLIKNLVFHAQVLVRNGQERLQSPAGITTSCPSLWGKGCAGIRSSPNEEMCERGHGDSPSLEWSDLSSPSPKGNTEKTSDQAAHLFSALYFPQKRKLFHHLWMILRQTGPIQMDKQYKVDY